MSIGPLDQNIQPEVSRFDRINHNVKKVIEAYFNRPLHYLFCLAGLSILILLILNLEVTWQLYIGFGLLTTYELWKFEFNKPNDKK